MANVTTKVEPQSILLEKLMYGCSKVLEDTPQLKHDLRISTYEDMTMGMVVNLRSAVMAEELARKTVELVVETPENWWQMLKEQYSPKWIKDKFPIRNKQIKKSYTFKKLAAYPNLPRVFKDCGNVIYKERIEEEIND